MTESTFASIVLMLHIILSPLNLMSQPLLPLVCVAPDSISPKFYDRANIGFHWSGAPSYTMSPNPHDRPNITSIVFVLQLT